MPARRGPTGVCGIEGVGSVIRLVRSVLVLFLLMTFTRWLVRR